MKTYNAMVMSFDGEHKIEGEFPTVDKAWDYINNMGSRWYFYPFCFVVKSKTIVASPPLLEFCDCRRINTVANWFKIHSSKPEHKNMDVEDYIMSFRYNGV